MKNITLVNPYVWEHFFDKNSFDSVDEMQTAYEAFIEENKEIVSKIDEMIEHGEFQSINETYGYDMSNEIEMLTERKLGKKPLFPSSSSMQSIEPDGYADDIPVTTVKKPYKINPVIPASADEIEREEINKKGATIVKQHNPDINPVDVKIVRNIDYDSTSINDVHYCVQKIYENLVKNNHNYDVITPFSLLDTEAVSEMDALFAFMDIPNVDLSYFDTSNVVNMEGMFYKSTFNNDSIKNWDVSNVNNMRNMFIGSSMTNLDYIKDWYPNTKNHALPKLGVDNTEELDTNTVINKLFGDEETIKQKYKDRISYSNESWHVMSSSEFIAEGNFGDYFRKKTQDVKTVINNISIKLRNGMDYLFDKFGNMLNVITPNASVEYIKTHNIPGVCVGEDYTDKLGYYEKIEEGSQEYDNYIEFLKMTGSGNLNEARITMSSNKTKSNGAAAPNIDAPDWNSAQLEKYLRKAVYLKQKHPGREQRPLVIWGAPGIGKSSIPKTVIKEMNKELNNYDETTKMTVLVADCSQMSSDGFSLPTPAKQQDVEKLISSNKEASRLAKEYGIPIEKLQAIEYKVSDDAPKTWLPVYKPTGDRHIDEILNALANSAIQEIIDEDGYVIGYEKTGSGGILLIDEFLRADKQTFFIVCQLMFNGRYGNYVLGNKWQIVAASNRPSDDRQVRTNFADAAAAGFNRLARCNFVPSFNEWKTWAKKHGFDETMLSFIAGASFDGPDSRWHNFDPELKNTQNNPAFASPRSWADVISDLQDEMEFEGYSSYGEIPKTEFQNIVNGRLPEKLAQEFTDYYYMNSDTANPYTYDNILKMPMMIVKNKSIYKCASICDNIVTTVRLRYNRNNVIPPEEFEALMTFLCNNYPADPNIIYNNFYQQVFKICNLEAPTENATPEEIALENSYDEVGTIFTNKFPEFVKSLNEE